MVENRARLAFSRFRRLFCYPVVYFLLNVRRHRTLPVKRNTFRSLLFGAFLVSTGLLVGCSSIGGSTTPRSSHALVSSDAAVSLDFVAYAPERRARLRLTNNSIRAIAWEGYPGTPWYRVRQRDLFGWHERDVGWFCGKGLETRQLPPHGSTEFSVDLPAWDMGGVQVGLDYTTPSKQSYSVWSSPFSPRE